MTLASLSLNNENGANAIIRYKSNLFKKDNLLEVYELYINFHWFVKNPNGKMEEHIHEFEKLYTKITQKVLY